VPPEAPTDPPPPPLHFAQVPRNEAELKALLDLTLGSAATIPSRSTLADGLTFFPCNINFTYDVPIAESRSAKVYKATAKDGATVAVKEMKELRFDAFMKQAELWAAKLLGMGKGNTPDVLRWYGWGLAAVGSRWFKMVIVMPRLSADDLKLKAFYKGVLQAKARELEASCQGAS
jgi:hypothetical protein